MIYDFNADAIFEMAEIIEKNGARYYRNAARRAPSDGTKKMLLNLADMEDEHGKIFAKLRQSLTRQENSPAVSELDPDARKYLTALAKTHVFEKKKKKPNLKLSEERSETDIMTDIYRTAIRAEKDSIVFYVGLKELVPQTFGKARIDDIIKEEMLHITTLSIELAGLES